MLKKIWYTVIVHLMNTIKWRFGWAVESSGLENRRSESYLGFESLTFRQERSRLNTKGIYIFTDGVAGAIFLNNFKDLLYMQVFFYLLKTT